MLRSRLKTKSSINHQVCLSLDDLIKKISYSALKQEKDYLFIDGQYLRTFYIAGYPFVAHNGWLDNLIKFNHSIDISFHLEEVPAFSALPKINRKITELESTKQTYIKAGKIIGSDLTDPLESAVALRDKILRGQEKLFLVALYINLRAKSLSSLNKLTQLVETAMASRMFYIKSAYFQQLEALSSVLPRSEDLLKQTRNMDSSTAALSFPFMSSELVQEKGILYGLNKSNNSLVIIDRFSLNNANSITFAQSGSGKSYLTKVEILRQLMMGVKVIVIDPEREYDRLATKLNGTVFKLAASSQSHINPLDFFESKQRSLNEHINDISQIIAVMVGGLTSRESSVLDKALLKIYSSKTNQPAILTDLHQEIIKLNALKLADRLDKYVNGSLAELFNRPTNVDLANRLIVFDIKDLNENVRQIIMLIVANYVYGQIKATTVKRLLIIDEGWLLLEHEESGQFIAGLVRRARKYWLGVAIISQQANDFMANKYGRAIVSQSALRILMRQDSTVIKNVVEQFSLSEYEQSYLLSCDRGEALIIADQNHVAVSILASRDEHPLITTDPNELSDFD